MFRRTCPYPLAALAALALLALGPAVAGDEPAAAEGSPVESAPAEAQPPVFEFHNPIALNLHHFLYWKALPHSRESGEVADWPESLSTEQRKAVDAAVAYYRDTFEGQDLLRGRSLYRIKTQLAGHDGSDSLAGLALYGDHVAVLEPLLPIYRRHLWPAHEAANRRWIEHASALVERWGAEVVKRLAAAYQDPFPPTPVRVDVVVEGHWAGAYTTVDPVHVVITGSRAGNAGKGALEIVFHEASHDMVGPDRGTAIDKLARAFEARGEQTPRGLWHALLFYTTGRVVEGLYREAGLGPYECYVYRHDLWNGPWGAFRETLEQDWQPYLDGRATMDAAVRAIVERLSMEDGGQAGG